MPGEPPTRLKLAQESYQEVLDATKHQDDKIGRLLTAIAFLTGGALVFVNRGILDVRYAVGGQPLPLPGLAFGAFLLFVALSVLELVLSLTTPLTLPGEKGQRRSHLYFKLIANETKQSWNPMWFGRTNVLRQEVESEYVSEVLNIANRAEGKNARLTQAATLTLAAMLFFSLAFTLSIDVLVTAPPQSDVATETVDQGRSSVTTSPVQRPALPWTMLRRALVGATLAAFALVLILQYRRQVQDFSDRVQRRVEGRSNPAVTNLLTALAGVHPTFVISTVMSTDGRSDWDCIVWTTGVAALLLVAGSFALGSARTIAGVVTTAGAVVIVGVATVPLAFWVGGGNSDHARLVIAVVAVVLLLLPTPVRAILTTQRRLRTAERRKVLGGP